jgi:hypothetical protein
MASKRLTFTSVLTIAALLLSSSNPQAVQQKHLPKLPAGCAPGEVTSLNELEVLIANDALILMTPFYRGSFNVGPGNTRESIMFSFGFPGSFWANIESRSKGVVTLGELYPGQLTEGVLSAHAYSAMFPEMDLYGDGFGVNGVGFGNLGEPNPVMFTIVSDDPSSKPGDVVDLKQGTAGLSLVACGVRDASGAGTSVGGSSE